MLEPQWASLQLLLEVWVRGHVQDYAQVTPLGLEMSLSPSTNLTDYRSSEKSGTLWAPPHPWQNIAEPSLMQKIIVPKSATGMSCPEDGIPQHSIPSPGSYIPPRPCDRWRKWSTWHTEGQVFNTYFQCNNSCPHAAKANNGNSPIAVDINISKTLVLVDNIHLAKWQCSLPHGLQYGLLTSFFLWFIKICIHLFLYFVGRGREVL